MPETHSPQRPPRRKRGFERAAGLVEKNVRTIGESRGFAVTRLLTHWAEIAGPEIAAATRPVKVSYAKGGFGATLTLLTTGAQAPMIEAQLPKLRERVNACYGYAAISRIRLTQTAPTGFREGQADFNHAPRPKTPKTPPPEAVAAARDTADGVADDTLRQALTRLGANILTRKS